MGLSVTFVAGLRGCGKSTIIHEMIEQYGKRRPHYMRLVKKGSDKHPPAPTTKSPADCGVASARWLEYDAEHVFEILSEALTAVHREDRFGSVVLEAETDSVLRNAYPYDNRVFVMPTPTEIADVFRDPHRAAIELKRVLEDTAAFASEIFGLFEESSQEEVDPSEPRAEMGTAGMRGFLYSPLGDELATRIQLLPEFHGLVESEVVVVNTSVGRSGSETAECLRRIGHLLQRVRGVSDNRHDLFLCDLLDPKDVVRRKLMKALRPMTRGGR